MSVEVLCVMTSFAHFAILFYGFSATFFFISDESADKQGEQGDSMEDHLEMLDRVRRESEENRKFWKEELRSMNKWEKYGLG